MFMLGSHPVTPTLKMTQPKGGVVCMVLTPRDIPCVSVGEEVGAKSRVHGRPGWPGSRSAPSGTMHITHACGPESIGVYGVFSQNGPFR